MHFYIYFSELIEQKDISETLSTFIPAPQTTLVNQEQDNDPIQTIIEEHKQTAGFYRIPPARRVLVPHKISMDNIFGDQTHLIVDPKQSSVYSTNSMSLSDLNHNQHQLKDVGICSITFLTCHSCYTSS